MITDELKEKRKAAKITQEEMASKLGISRATYIRAEKTGLSFSIISRAFAELGYQFCIIKANEITIL